MHPNVTVYLPLTVYSLGCLLLVFSFASAHLPVFLILLVADMTFVIIVIGMVRAKFSELEERLRASTAANAESSKSRIAAEAASLEEKKELEKTKNLLQQAEDKNAVLEDKTAALAKSVAVLTALAESNMRPNTVKTALLRKSNEHEKTKPLLQQEENKNAVLGKSGVVWPASLQELSFGRDFNQPLTEILWPASLRTATGEGVGL